MKKIIALLLCLVLVCTVFTSCGTEKEVDFKYPRVATTSHVIADWVWNILDGSYDTFQITLLTDEGKDMHNYQPSAADMRNIATADLVVYIGGDSDKWVEDAVKSVGGDVKTLKLLDLIQEHNEECADLHSHGTDEHIWLSFENAIKCVRAIADAVCEIDAEKLEIYRNNADEYIANLDELYGEYKSAVAGAKYKTLVFADRFPFVYLMEELGLDYYAAFPGCSSETSASFETVITLARKIDELSLPCVLTIESSSDGIAETVVENTSSKSAQILALDSMQIMNGEGFDYLAVMKSNLLILKTALGCGI